MALFFKIETAADAILMQAYDDAVTIFRDAVATEMEIAAARHPDLGSLLYTAAKAMRLRPLPSEANKDEDALRRLALSGLTVEKVFAAIGPHAALQDVINTMRDTAKMTTSRPELKPLTQRVLQAVAAVRPEIVAEMEEKDFDFHLKRLSKNNAHTPPKFSF